MAATPNSRWRSIVDGGSRGEAPHPGDERLTGVGVGLNANVGSSWTSLEVPLQLFLIDLRLGLDRQADDGLREVHPLEEDTGASGSQIVSPVWAFRRPTTAAMSPAQSSWMSSALVRSRHLRGVGRRVGLGAWRGCRPTSRRRGGRSRPREGECPTNGSVMILKTSAAKGRVIRGRPGHGRAGVGVDALDGGDVERRRSVSHDGIEKRLDAAVVESRAAKHGNERHRAQVPRGARRSVELGRRNPDAPERYFRGGRRRPSHAAPRRPGQRPRRGEIRLGMTSNRTPTPVASSSHTRRPHADDVDPPRKASAVPDGMTTGSAARGRRSAIIRQSAIRKSAPTRSICVDGRRCAAREYLCRPGAKTVSGLRLDSTDGAEHRDGAVREREASARPRR